MMSFLPAKINMLIAIFLGFAVITGFGALVKWRTWCIFYS
jgi:hypothetical protein